MPDEEDGDVRGRGGAAGSPSAYGHDGSADEVDLYLGTFDDPARFPVGEHVRYGERVVWSDTVDRTPRFRADSGSGEPPVAAGPAAG